MASKHDILTQEEFDTFNTNPWIWQKLKEFTRGKHEIKVLDYGCGRGRSVLNLLKNGFNAYGVDVDVSVMKNGYALFTNMGYSPEERLMTFDELQKLPDGYFDFIFSEEVFEHIEESEKIARELYRVASSNSLSVHTYPGTFAIMEEHVHLPFVHWLPKNIVRKFYLFPFIALGFHRGDDWGGKTVLGKTNTYYDYLDKKTYYRDIRDVIALFEKVGFRAKEELCQQYSHKLLRNGFPKNRMLLVLKKD